MVLMGFIGLAIISALCAWDLIGEKCDEKKWMELENIKESED